MNNTPTIRNCGLRREFYLDPGQAARESGSPRTIGIRYVVPIAASHTRIASDVPTDSPEFILCDSLTDEFSEYRCAS